MLLFIFALVVSAAGSVGAFPPPPKESVKLLKVTRGKPFTKGVVFVDGKYLEPPYVVERYGNVLRINGIQISGPVIEWSEFLKTQSGAVITRTESAPVPLPVALPKPPPKPVAPVVDDPFDELFDDGAARKSAKKVADPPPRPQPVARTPPIPNATTTVTFDGEFEMNDMAKTLIERINAVRKEIDMTLRCGGFYCFGSGYSRVSGDQGAANRILARLPEIMKRSIDCETFAAEIRRAGFVYFPPRLVEELFANRVECLAIEKRWKRLREEMEYDSMLERSGIPVY